MTFLTFDELSSTFLPVLRDRTLMPGLITINAEAAARAHVGKKVSMAKMRRRAATRRVLGATTAITMTSSVEDEVSITLTEDIYDARPITDAELTLDIRDFGTQVMDPMLRAVADEIDSDIAALIEGATYPAAGQIAYTAGAGPLVPVISARSVLNTNEVPMDGRILLVGDDLEQELLGLPQLAEFDKSGTTSTLRDAILGRLYGFTVVAAGNKIAADKAYAFHRSAFMAAMRGPIVPAGAVSGSSSSYEGVPLTILRDYDADTSQDRLLMRVFYGDTVNTDHVGTQTATYNPVLLRAAEITVASA